MTTEPNTSHLLDESLTSATADLEVGGDGATGSAPYAPGAVFSVEEGDGRNVPRVLIAPSRYIQGEGVLEHLGRYLSVVPSTRPALLISAGGQRRDGTRIVQGLRAADLDPVEVTFGGECSEEEVERMADALRAEHPPVDCVVAVGGGKCVDAGKCVATRLGVPVVICPTIASNDAPCSALSVMYAPEAALVFSCAGRHAMLGTRVGRELEQVKERVGVDVPTIGFYTYSEFFPLSVSANPRAHGSTFVTVLLGESE